MNAARATVRGWGVELRAVLGELGVARLRWCLLCSRVGLWGWRPLTPSMSITWVCTDLLGCRERQVWTIREFTRGSVRESDTPTG